MIRKFLMMIATGLLKLCLKVRYNIQVKGLEVLKDKALKDKPVVIYPSHPAAIDPFILMSIFGSKMKVRPLITENFYYYPLARPMMKLVGALPVAEFDTAVTDYKFKQTEKLYNEIVEKLKSKKEKILLYPSAVLKRMANERVGGRSMAYSLVQDADPEIVLVRIQGLWGSSFSTARTNGKTPDFWAKIFRGILIALKNGIFFVPRRKVTVEFLRPPEDFPKNGTKQEFNSALEKVYNQYVQPDGSISENEPPTLVKEFCLSKRLPKLRLYQEEETKFKGDLYVPKHVRQDVLYQVSELSGKSVKDIHDSQDLIYDLGLDSMDKATLFTHIDSNYELDKNIEPADLRTVQDLLAAAVHMKKKTQKPQPRTTGKSSWPSLRSRRPKPKVAEGTRCFEIFFNSCKRMGNHPACADAAAGVLSYKRMSLAVIIMAKQIQKIEGQYVGVLLPNLCVSNILILAIQLAGKVPVPINWTVGQRSINHAISLLGVKNIITADRFLKKLSSVDLGDALDRLVLVEDIRKEITFADKMKALWLSKRSTKAIIEHFGSHTITENDPAVVIFTSGSTSLPKAVELTHKNLISNQKCALKGVDLNANDVMLKTLPLFHIFGMNISLMPLFAGTRVYFSPDPLDGSTLAKEILKWRCSVIMLAPTFLAHLFRNASLNQLKPLRVIISGAEKAPQAVKEFCNKLGHAQFIEGYGLTETSPVITINEMYQTPRGVGRVIDCLKVVIRDPESGEIRSPYQVGEVVVSGDSVFNGYYKTDNTPFFVEIDGDKYFRTGDLGHLDEDNFLYLDGRLKFSFKRGGEMISSVAIETELLSCAKEKGWINPDTQHNVFAVLPNETQSGSTKIVLFSEIELTLEQVNSALFERGFARLYKINEIIQVERLPMLKSGKTHYAVLLDMIQKRAATRIS